jgi:hypothetical protein
LESEGKVMDNFIEGEVFWAPDGSPALYINSNNIIPLVDGQAIKLYNGESWINGVHVGGDIIYSEGQVRLLLGGKIRIRK